MKKLKIDIKRKLIQIAAFGFTNSRITNFFGGKIYTGKWKQFCVPSLNCYSCPAATFACPIGAMQAISGSMNFNFSFYIVGFLLAVGVILGRAVCGFLCPFGLIQELIYKVPVKKIRLAKWMKYIKYIILTVFVIIIPFAITDFMGMGKPAFCEYICPAGTLEGGIPLLATHKELRSTIGALFSLKVTILIIIVMACMFNYRFFCKLLCPLGAIYGLLNKFSILHISVDKSKCIKCNKCASECKMEVNPLENPNSIECIRCGKCTQVCPSKAIMLGVKNRN